MTIVVMLCIGLVIGLIAKLLLPGRDPGGILVTMALGVAGSIAAGMVGREMGWYAHGERVGIIASVVGAVGLLAIYRATLGGRATNAR